VSSQAICRCVSQSLPWSALTEVSLFLGISV
jgi:hypothetical protein